MVRPDGGTSRACARALGDRPGRPPSHEGALIAATLGQALRQLRLERGMSTRLLARRAAVSRSMITRLESGERRPRRSMLSALAMGLDPDRHRELLEVLVAAAGASLAPESNWSRRARRRRMEQGILAGAVPLPAAIARPLALHRRADAAHRRAMALMSTPGMLDDVPLMAEISDLLELSRELRDQAGPAIVFYVGGQVIRAGFG